MTIEQKIREIELKRKALEKSNPLEAEFCSLPNNGKTPSEAAFLTKDGARTKAFYYCNHGGGE